MGRLEFEGRLTQRVLRPLAARSWIYTRNEESHQSIRLTTIVEHATLFIYRTHDMSSSASGRRALYVTVTSYAAGGVALAAAGAWLFAELLSFTALRNANHYLLDYRIHRLQAVPWGCIVAGLAALPVAACGWAGARRRAGGALAAHAALLAVLILVYAAFAGLVFAYVDERSTEEFVKDTVYDGFYSAKTDEGALAAFGQLERRLGCCGANDARDYRSWRDAPPPTCCAATDAVCDFTSREANERVGCSRVTAVRARYAALWLAAAAVLSAVLQAGALVATCRLLLRPRPMKQNIEMESTKTLLYEKPV
ncbi:hypothetical protein EVAR_91247_1 [Eumeta japonica]|uniref:Tetraspanin n=1 Tax=Eumeta variegata TaxID=151549 RepID=A0A4C2A288_EUMVA|nr:hypothetical protein EVAR_91247_1 [Eumeta japonica]